MNIFHEMAWDKCLSHEIWPALKEGWPETDENVHFLWGLAGKNRGIIRECKEKKEDFWYVDVGYLTQQITRYPEPKINDYDKTYFRIVKNKLHTTSGSVGNGDRLNILKNQGIDVEFKGWNTSTEVKKHILVCPSSQTVTYDICGVSQEEWINEVVKILKEFTDKEIRVRNKPRPGNEWWGTDIKDDLVNCQCLVTSMSLSAIDAILNRTPVICHTSNVASLVGSNDLKFVEKPMKPGHKTIREWMRLVVDNQFTLEEMRNGTAYKYLNQQQENIKMMRGK